jgi:hypothetical protein
MCRDERGGDAGDSWEHEVYALPEPVPSSCRETPVVANGCVHHVQHRHYERPQLRFPARDYDRNPKIGTPSTVMRVFKQRVSRRLRAKKRRTRSSNQLALWRETPLGAPRSFWQRRFYDFNVWSRKKRIEKLNYMHMNPVKRKLAAAPQLWLWSSYRFYQYEEKNLCTPDREPK